MKQPSAKEALIMKEILNENGISTPDLVEKLNTHYNLDYARTTVVTMVGRLEEKGYLKTKRRGKRSYIYSLISKEEYLTNMMDYVVDLYFDGDREACRSHLG